MRLLIKNIGALEGGESAEWLLCDGGLISAMGSGEPPAAERELDARGALVTPGLIDCHTHMAFGGWRQREIPMKIGGAGYLDILAAGGGILDTVRHTRALSESELLERTRGFAREMLAQGVTTVEGKSGYGLDTETELRQLAVMHRLGEETPLETAVTFRGAHAVPPEYAGRADDYVDFLCGELLPAVREQGYAEFCDVFCETGVFDVPQSRRVLERARELGFRLKIHADEIDAIGGAQLAGELGAISAEHLIATDERGMEALAAGGVTAVLLPSTSLYLGKSFARARDMAERGVRVAVATDFNPGSCPSLNIQLCIMLACQRYRLFPREVLAAVTENAAAAIGREGRIGRLAPGMQADIVIWNAPDIDTLCYRFGSNLAKTVIKKGEIVHEAD
ncbi:MAG: imidazolonepropionase [Clostridia bacterium]|nr:imidazolonepropionase [Clostridia bacterium]